MIIENDIFTLLSEKTGIIRLYVTTIQHELLSCLPTSVTFTVFPTSSWPSRPLHPPHRCICHMAHIYHVPCVCHVPWVRHIYHVHHICWEANANTRTSGHLGMSILIVIQCTTSVCCDEDVECKSRNEPRNCGAVCKVYQSWWSLP